uniref:Uncharacterized protein n=1 Tax=Anguilla anguilla TaxID=7936 RepID=A0A0E9P9K7_ANGAN
MATMISHIIHVHPYDNLIWLSDQCYNKCDYFI